MSGGTLGGVSCHSAEKFSFTEEFLSSCRVDIKPIERRAITQMRRILVEVVREENLVQQRNISDSVSVGVMFPLIVSHMFPNLGNR